MSCRLCFSFIHSASTKSPVCCWECFSSFVDISFPSKGVGHKSQLCLPPCFAERVISAFSGDKGRLSEKSEGEINFPLSSPPTGLFSVATCKHGGLGDFSRRRSSQCCNCSGVSHLYYFSENLSVCLSLFLEEGCVVASLLH